CEELVEACGGRESLLERARKALAEGRSQLALELADIVLSTVVDRPTMLLRAEALRRLADAATSKIARTIYGTAAGPLVQASRAAVKASSLAPGGAALRASGSRRHDGYVNVGNLKLHHVDYGGTGEVVVALHGFIGTAQAFDHLAPLLVPHVRLIALDL